MSYSTNFPPRPPCFLNAPILCILPGEVLVAVIKFSDPIMFRTMLIVLHKMPYLHFSHQPMCEMFWMPSVSHLQNNKRSKNNEGTVTNAHSTSFSLWLSLTLYWCNYSSSPRVPLATDEEVSGCLSTPLPRSEDIEDGAALPPAPWWDAAGRGDPQPQVLRDAVLKNQMGLEQVFQMIQGDFEFYKKHAGNVARSCTLYCMAMFLIRMNCF